MQGNETLVTMISFIRDYFFAASSCVLSRNERYRLGNSLILCNLDDNEILPHSLCTSWISRCRYALRWAGSDFEAGETTISGAFLGDDLGLP